MLKGLKIFDKHLRTFFTLEAKLAGKNQLAYLKGRFVDAAIQRLVA